MKTPLHILHLEDDPAEVDLVHDTLNHEGVSCSITYAQDRAGFLQALDRGTVDLIIADQSLPGFDGLTALKLTRARWPDLPFILMSGTVGEEFAVETLKSGATDYILKDRRNRLVPAVRRAMREVTERRERHRLEEQFVQAQKMEVVGQLASGIAHDFNNILGIVIGNNDYMMSKLGPDDPLRKNGEEIRHAAERAAAVTRQLLVFSRNQATQPVVLDLNEVIRGMDKMLARLVNENIDLTFELGKPLGRIKADSGQVGQLLMNFVINARDALPFPGKISVSTSNVKLDDTPDKLPPDTSPGHYVLLAVRDTGTGMSEEVKARLFEPFFTTKPTGKGTGLGLTTCRNIARQSNAGIEVESEPGKGTVFRVYFPRVDQPLQTTTSLLHTATVPRGTETVLLVEDESALRRMTSLALENLGYVVVQAANGQEGLQAAQDHKGPPIALAITDVIMPQMGGKVMSEWLKAGYPGMKILFTSGYADSTIVNQGVLDPTVAFVPKPYTLATLAGKIREVLDAPSN